MRRLLTKAETALMNVLWKMPDGRGHGTEIVKRYPQPQPALTTVLTFLKILERKGYITSQREGRSNVFIPLVTRDEYRKIYLENAKDIFFDESGSDMVKFLIDNQLVSIDEVKALVL